LAITSITLGAAQMTKILHLTLHREFFAAIAAGKKRTEYRKAKPYWKKRLEGRDYDLVKFRNGYAADAPEMLVEFRGIRREGKGRSANSAILRAEIERRLNVLQEAGILELKPLAAAEVQ
jgi:hypothetical protein